MYKKIISYIYLLLLLFFSTSYLIAADKIKNNSILFGKENAPVKIKVFSSLTCPHCANFHINILPKIKEKYIDSGQVQVLHIDFPLDLAALNAGKLLHCINDNEKQIQILEKIYQNQNVWTLGNGINDINENLINLFNDFEKNTSKLNKCLNNEDIEEIILENRIDAQKKYNLEATPTIIINEKKFEGSVNFKNIDKIIEKLI
tara:strand:- start:451 stop:1059 length:609 start_codon:yes stop_codon:yes gene_type:complete